MLVGRAWAGGAWAAGRVGTPGGPSLVGPGAQGALLPGVAGEAAGGPWLAWANGGNCSIRGATRRRHAVAMRLMVQNPPLGGGPSLAAGWAARAGCVVAGCSWRCARRAVAGGGRGRGWRGQMGEIAALGVRHADDTP